MNDVITFATGVQVKQDWERDGYLVITNAKSIKRYQELKYEVKYQPDCDKIGVFWAFTNEQFKEGYDKLVKLGHIKDGDKVLRVEDINGLFGTRDCLKKFFDAYKDVDNVIRDECDPQEVYLFEYNNYESFIAFDGDKSAYNTIRSIWGDEVAKTIRRF